MGIEKENDKTVLVNFGQQGGTTVEAIADESLEEAYKELGQLYYEGKFEDPLPELLPLFDEITKLRNQKMIKQNKCPQCGREISTNALFCGSCGYRLR